MSADLSVGDTADARASRRYRLTRVREPIAGYCSGTTQKSLSENPEGRTPSA